MREIRLLVTGVGRRIELIQAFRQAAQSLNIVLKIYGADMAGNAPALSFCDYTRKVCSMRDENYIPDLLKICIKDKIDMVVPTIDTDLLILSKNTAKFDEIGAKVLISKEDKIAVCRDKNNTGAFFESCGVKAPKTFNDYKNYNLDFPCFIKPKDGSSSINAFKVNDADELGVYAEQIEDYVIQPYIDGKEYTIDIFCDFDGNPVYIVPRERVQVRAGEVLKTRIEMNTVMIEESRRIIKKFKPCGPITVQLIHDSKTDENYYIEINPRFGGGAPLSMKAGARSAEACLKLILGQKAEYKEEIDNEAVFSRFDQSVCIDSGDWNQPVRGIIFDLDDTLYSEKEYIRSGYKKIASFMKDDTAEQKMWDFFLEGKKAIDFYLNETENEKYKDKCIEIYRNQMPDIALYDGIHDLLLKLREEGIKVGIITDGRPEGQRNKLAVLGLPELVDDVVITDELGGVQFRKPNDISFRIMQNRWGIPFEQIVYVGDNISKDFIAPKMLGMKSIYFNNPDGLYRSDEKGIDNIDELISAIVRITYGMENV